MVLHCNRATLRFCGVEMLRCSGVVVIVALVVLAVLVVLVVVVRL